MAEPTALHNISLHIHLIYSCFLDVLMYIPSIIPEEDRKIIEERYRRNGIDSLTEIGKRPVVLVVDMTNGFVDDKFPTGYSKTGIPCATSIGRLLVETRNRDIPTIYTKDVEETGELYSLHRGAWNFKGKPVSDEMKEEYNTIYAPLKPGDRDLVLRKSKPSAFFGTPLIALLNYMKADSIILTGMVTSGCIRATALDAFNYNYRVILPAECVADRSQISHEVSLFDLDAKYASVLPLKEVLELLKKLR